MKFDMRPPKFPEVVEIGDIVVTTKGFEFECIAVSGKNRFWRDLITGITWHPAEAGIYNLEDSGAFQDRLPSKDEFEEAEKHGIRELSSDWNAWFWASTRSHALGFAFLFFQGKLYSGNCNFNKGAVRFVDR